MPGEIKTFGPFDVMKILNYLPHRQPFLFVDRIREVKVRVGGDGKFQHIGTTAVGIKNATVNEFYFTGHFPNAPITPGVVLIETMAQVASFAVLPWAKPDEELRITRSIEPRLISVDKARFRKLVIPGDTMVVTAECVKYRKPFWGFNCKIEVDGAIAAEAEVLASVVLPDETEEK